MVKSIVRQVVASTFVQNHHHVLKKVSITILSLKRLTAAAMLQELQMERCLQAVFMGSVDTEPVQVSTSLDYVKCSRLGIERIDFCRY